MVGWLAQECSESLPAKYEVVMDFFLKGVYELVGGKLSGNRTHLSTIGASEVDNKNSGRKTA